MAAKIRLLFAIGSLGAGGSERQLLSLLEALDRDRFAPCLYTVYRDGELLDEVPVDVPVESYDDHPQAFRINYPGRILMQQGRQLAERARRFRADLICDRNWQMTLVAARASQQARVPRISIVGSHPARDLQARGGRFRFWKQQLLGRAYHTANRIVAVSEGVRLNAIELFALDPSKIETIHSFVDIQRVEQRAAAYQPELLPDRFHVVAVGRLQSEKGYHFLFQAIEQLVQQPAFQRLRLTVIGRGPQENELIERIRQRQLEPYIQLLGYLQNPLPYVRHAELYCLPSLYEGMPNALEEAVVCGVPVLATDCPSGPSEILEKGKHGRLVPPGDADALAAAIADAMQNHASWLQRTSAARQYVVEHFSREASIKHYERLFAEVAAS